MSTADNTEQPEPAVTRAVGGTEYSWCRTVPGGTGITVLALLLSKPPNLSHLQTSFSHLLSSHPILRSHLHFDSSTSSFSFKTPPFPHLQLQVFDFLSTKTTLETLTLKSPYLTPFHLILEHEINLNPWTSTSSNDLSLFYATVYMLSETKSVLVLRLHTSACDRTSAAALLRELLELIGAGDGDGDGDDYREEMGVAIEKCVPNGKSNKPFWVKGIDVVGYSLNAFRLANLDFVDAQSTRCSQVIRLQINSDQSLKLLEGCKSRGIKLSGALAAACLIAVHSTKDLPHHQFLKYAVVTLVDCRPNLDPALNSHNFGFYHSAILNTHDISGNDKLWDVAKRCYVSFANAMKNNKHFTDMGDLNFLMSRAIDNPGLTPSSSSRTACISVFQDTVIDESKAMYEKVGLEDYVGCASIHGIGPSIALFDTIRDGRLDCACVYPSPLHSREQMQNLIDDMKRILVEFD